MKRYLFPFLTVVILSFTITIILLFGKQKDKKNWNWIPQPRNQNEILCYDRWNLKLFLYDLQKKQNVFYNQEDNFFQMAFSTPSDFYTSGHSIKNHFCILKCGPKKASIVYRMPEHEAVFPLAQRGRNLFFMHTFETKKGRELLHKRCIAKFDEKTKTLQDDLSTKGCIDHAAIDKQFLYYTVCREDNNYYDLYKKDYIHSQKKPVKIEENLKNGILLISKEGLWKSDGSVLYHDKQTIPLANENMADEYSDSLIQLYIDEHHALSLSVKYFKTGKQYLNFPNVLDYRIKGHQLTIYGMGYVKHTTLKKG